MQIETRLIARYSETDQMGIIHHSNYAVWFEAGRIEFLKKVGISNIDIEAKGVLLPLYEMSCKFKSPARSEDEIMVITSLKQISRVRLCFSYQVINAINRKLLANGETMHAWTDKALKPINVTKAIPNICSLLSKTIDVVKVEVK
ncbi:MAG: acyl-CoA thioesterase [Negativicutes bacterium]|nr:acyl-CoA thioesterase [Negativicutes bacterium]